MRKFILCLLLGALLGITSSPLLAQQNQSTQTSNPEIQALKKRVSELEKQLQTVENVEKMDLARNYTDANAKLINVDFDKLKWELKDSNSKWLTGWILFFLAILSAVGVGVWSWLKSRTNQLIETEVEKHLSGFKEAVNQVGVMKDELRELEKKHVVSVLETIIGYSLQEEHFYPEPIKTLQEETLLQILDDEARRPAIRYKAADVLLARKSSQLVSPLLNLLNSLVDLDSDPGLITNRLEDGVKYLAYIHTPEAHQGLNRLLNRLLTEDLKSRNWFLGTTVVSLAKVSIKLNTVDSIPILKTAIPYLKNLKPGDLEGLSELAEYFDKFNEPEGIKEILINHITSGMPEVEDRCLELLQKHDTEFVKEWRARTTDNSNA